MKTLQFESETHTKSVNRIKWSVRKAQCFTQVAMKGLGRYNNDFNTTLFICPLTFQLFQTDEDFTVNGRKHTHTHTGTFSTTFIYCKFTPAFF